MLQWLIEWTDQIKGNFFFRLILFPINVIVTLVVPGTFTPCL